jgi:hypothetical protein
VAAASGLDPAWDGLAGSPFQRRAFLAHCEAENPCRQDYWEWHRDGRLRAGMVTYDLRLDLLTYAGLKSPVRMRMLGVPASVSCAGVIGDGGDVRDLVAAAVPRLRGLVVGLNLEADADPGLPGVACGRTLPSMALDLPFPTWDAYRGALRSDYRRRLLRLGARWDGVTTVRMPCREYDAALHGLYVQVWQRSRARLERLDLPFFQGLPEGFHLAVHRDGDRPLAWHVVVTEGTRRWFFLGGLDYAVAGTRASYFNLLAAIVKEAIEDGMTWLDLGQTAEVPKARLGAVAIEKRLFGWHRWGAVRWALRRGRAWLEYPVRVPGANVFR